MPIIGFIGSGMMVVGALAYISVVLSQSATEDYSAKVAVGIIKNAQYLQTAGMNLDVDSRADIMREYKVPLSSMIVKDSYSEAEINAFSKQFEATMVVLKNTPNASDAELDCNALAATKKITVDECSLVDGRTFKVYALKNGQVNYEISLQDEKIANYTNSMQATSLNMIKQQIDFNQTAVDFNINNSDVMNSNNIKKSNNKIIFAKRNIEDLIASNDVVEASRALKSLSNKVDSESDLIVIGDKLASKIIENDLRGKEKYELKSVHTAREVEENEFLLLKSKETRANIIETVSLIRTKSISSDIDLKSSMSADLHDVLNSADGNEFINSRLLTETISFMN